MRVDCVGYKVARPSIFMGTPPLNLLYLNKSICIVKRLSHMDYT